MTKFRLNKNTEYLVERAIWAVEEAERAVRLDGCAYDRDHTDNSEETKNWSAWYGEIWFQLNEAYEALSDLEYREE